IASDVRALINAPGWEFEVTYQPEDGLSFAKAHPELSAAIADALLARYRIDRRQEPQYGDGYRASLRLQLLALGERYRSLGMNPYSREVLWQRYREHCNRLIVMCDALQKRTSIVA